MKKHLALLLCFMLLLNGCGTAQQTTVTLPESTSPSAATESVPSESVTPEEPEVSELYAVSVPAVTERITADDGTELFSYTAQHMQLILPDENIADNVILDFLNRVDAARLDAESTLEAAKRDYQPDIKWFPYFYQIIYSPMRIDRGVLSLFGIQNNYSGAMHGSLSCVAANYDLTTGDALTLGSIMHMNATRNDFIEIITKKLGEYAEEYSLFESYEDGVRCRLDVDENLYEDFFFTETGLNFFFAPYEIAPYSSGVITVEIPYNELTGLIYDGYFPAERETIHGSMNTGSFAETNMEQFDSMAEVTLSVDQETLVAYPEGKVEDIRITISGNSINMPDYTVFAALEMSGRNAVIIHLSHEEMQNATISYRADGTSKVISLSD